MELSLTFFAFAVPAVLFAGVSKGGFGSGAAFAATPFLALILMPETAVALMLPLLMIMDISAIKAYWRKWDWQNAKTLMIGALPGILFGWMMFRIANPDLLRFLIGAVAVGFVLFQFARSRGWIEVAQRSFNPITCGIWGAVAGFTSFISHAGGPPASIQLLSQRLDKFTFQATTVVVFWWINLVKFVPYSLLGMFSKQTFIAVLALAPVAIGGTLLGVWLHKKMSDRIFFILAYTFLLITGAKLIFDSLT